MQSLDTGQSPRINLRIPATLRAAIKAAAGGGRGDEARWVRRAIERELNRTACTCQTRKAART